MNKIKKITTMTFLGVASTGVVFAIDVQELGNGLNVLKYSKSDLDKAGCNETVWNEMVSEYAEKRGLQKKVEEKGKEQIVLETPKNEWEKCFSGALNKIDDLKNKINKVFSIFSGDFDLIGAATDLGNKYLEAQCNAINKMTTSAVGSVTGAATGAINSGVGAVTGGINDAVYDATGIRGASTIILGNSTSNADSLLGTEKITTGTVKDAFGNYSNLFGGSSGGSLVENLMK